MSTKVKFQGKEYWLLDDNHGALAYLEHCDEQGEVLEEEGLDALLGVTSGDSFAHVFEDGRIFRYGKQIGTREDLEVVGAKDN